MVKAQTLKTNKQKKKPNQKKGEGESKIHFLK